MDQLRRRDVEIVISRLKNPSPLKTTGHRERSLVSGYSLTVPLCGVFRV